MSLASTTFWSRPGRLACGGAVSLLCAAAACCPPEVGYRIALTPSLRPVDAARPMVVFSQIRGEACGRDAVAGALRDMKRLQPVDGYLEVTVEETGSEDERCARATAYPFRYGTNVERPRLRAGPPGTEPELVPGRAAQSIEAVGRPALDCDAACERFAGLLEEGAIARALARDRCLQRCTAPDEVFGRCIDSALAPAAAARCEAP